MHAMRANSPRPSRAPMKSLLDLLCRRLPASRSWQSRLRAGCSNAVPSGPPRRPRQRRVLFEHVAFGAQDTAAVVAALVAICAGLPGHVLEKVFGAVSFAHEDTLTPMLAPLGGITAPIIGGALLFPRFGYVGVAAAIAVSGWLGAGLLGTLLFRRRWLRIDAEAWRRLP